MQRWFLPKMASVFLKVESESRADIVSCNCISFLQLQLYKSILFSCHLLCLIVLAAQIFDQHNIFNNGWFLKFL